MDSCFAVEKEVDRVLTKYLAFNEQSKTTLADLVGFVQTLQIELNQAPYDQEVTPSQALLLTQCAERVKDVITAITTEHRDLHGSVSKVGKAIDKNFVPDFGSTSSEKVFGEEESQQSLNRVVIEHFLRHGMLDIAEELIREAQLHIEENKKEPFSELNQIIEALKDRNLKPSLEWACRNRDRLQAQGSFLEFKLHRLRFIELLQQGIEKQHDTVQYAREYFQHLATSHEKEIQVLMGSLLYLPQGVQNSPYSYILDPVHWSEICEVFTKDACNMLGLSMESPLTVCINAGCVALPALLNIRQVMQQRQVADVWNSRDELPIEIDLGQSGRFHSIFACPILRQQSSENNPPMRLVCGHVISRDALHKLANGNKLKCPYCPVEQSPSDAKMIHF
ncbi:protein RMD5 homolog A-like [Limulus polyphemus]|uniref:Protein RMD5 homolog A-like n=1 Tax=Limulus polyphemus TaxID=6850 RepID=A0ABM1B4I2_LIMPO|nr:protein RMD5 homolog A-like [Limulus polyphemus]XP_022241788.1 protein RMD5 homolog A-like [Limulus polyphemus]